MSYVPAPRCVHGQPWHNCADCGTKRIAAERFRRGEAVPIFDFLNDGAFPRLSR
jgi:hypothetical protein